MLARSATRVACSEAKPGTVRVIPRRIGHDGPVQPHSPDLRPSTILTSCGGSPDAGASVIASPFSPGADLFLVGMCFVALLYSAWERQRWWTIFAFAGGMFWLTVIARDLGVPWWLV